MAEQLPLALGHRPAFGREDFLVAPCNDHAVAWIDRYPDWPNRGLVVWGEAACGKSHLVEVWRQRTGGRVMAMAALDSADPRDLAAAAAGIAIEDVDRDRDGRRETVMFHLYNVMREQKQCLLLTGRRAPATWAVSLPDLRSRILALPAVGIGQPDDETIAAVLVKLLGDRQLAAGPEVLEFAVSRMERSFQAAHRLVSELDRQSLARRQRVSVALVRQVLAAQAGEETGGD